MLLAAAFIGASILIGAQQPPVDTILTNGKVITVDDQFSIAQAVAIRGARIVAVGTTQNITSTYSGALSGVASAIGCG
jgi:hypothetical protein